MQPSRKGKSKAKAKAKARGKDLRIVIGESVGFCSGVRRAIKIALAAADQSSSGVYSLGPLIHNPQVVDKLRGVGVKTLSRVGRGGGVLVVRSHGISPDVLTKAERRGYKIIDATCPFVRKAQRNAQRLLRMGYSVVIVGEKQHPEVKALRGYIDNRALVVEGVERVKRLKFGPKVGIIAQTTIPVETFADVVREITTRVREVLVFNTICSETARRQAKARKLAGQVDVLLVVGGRNSANTSRLQSLCQTICGGTHHIETADEIRSRWFKPGGCVGIVTGASTPKWLVRRVVKRLKQI